MNSRVQIIRKSFALTLAVVTATLLFAESPGAAGQQAAAPNPATARDPHRADRARGISAAGVARRLRDLSSTRCGIGGRARTRSTVEPAHPAGRRHAREHALLEPDPRDPEGRPRPDSPHRSSRDAAPLRHRRPPEVQREQVDLFLVLEGGHRPHADGAGARALRRHRALARSRISTPAIRLRRVRRAWRSRRTARST